MYFSINLFNFLQVGMVKDALNNSSLIRVAPIHLSDRGISASNL